METQKNGNGTTAIVKVGSGSSTAFEPRTSQEAYEMAKHYAASKLLGDLASADQVFLIMATGADLGVPATTALRAIHIVKGKPILSADLIKSLCIRRRDVCEFFRLVKSDKTHATYTAKRVGDEPVTMTFSMEDATRARLTSKGDESNWAKYPETMLRHRCTAMIAREVFPDLVLGVYCEEEAHEIGEVARIVEGEVIEQAAQDDLEERVQAFQARIEAAGSLDELKAITVDVSADPAADVIKGRLRDAYQARQKALKEQRQPGEEG